MQGLSPKDLFARGLHMPVATGTTLEWKPPLPEKLAEMLPQYHIEGLIGRGGMGAVYRGVQPALERPVAIKLLPAEFSHDAEFIARFQREARMLAKLHHAGIVAIYDFGQTGDGDLYFVMEFVDGTDLAHIIRTASLTPAQTLELTIQICDALHYAHGQGLIHRDIKPANILVTKEGRAKVADFGLARPVHEESGVVTVSDVVMGTAAYMAPEQREGHADHRADIYALGVMLYEMLTGKRPEGVFDPPSVKAHADARLDTIVLKAMQQEPDRRYQHASEMKTDVEEIRTTPVQSHSQLGERKAEAKKKPFFSQPLVFAAVVVPLLLIMGGLLYWKGDHSHGALAAEAAASASATLHGAKKERPFVELEGLNGFWASPSVPPDALKCLTRCSEDPQSNFRSFAFTETGDWVFLASGNKFYSNNMELPVCKSIAEGQRNDSDFQCVAFAPTGGWTIFFGGTGSWTQGEVPPAAYQKIVEIGTGGGELRSIAYGPKGAWVLLYDTKGVAFGDVPTELAKVLNEAIQNTAEVHCVAFSGKDWICLADNGWWTSNPNLPVAKRLSQGDAPKWIALSPELPAHKP